MGGYAYNDTRDTRTRARSMYAPHHMFTAFNKYAFRAGRLRGLDLALGSIYTGDIHPYKTEGIGEDFYPGTFDPAVVDRWVRVSDRDTFLTARRVTREATTPYQAAVLLEDWFQRTSTYDERATYAVNPIGALPAFVLTPKRRGHCQYFAGSMAVLLRMLGIPARVAAGFTPGTVDGAGRVITNRNAHVWVEVRFPYEIGRAHV